MKNPLKLSFTFLIGILIILLTGCSSFKLLPPRVNWDGGEVVVNVDCKQREELSFYHLWPRGDVNYALILDIISDFNDSDIAKEIGVCVKGRGINFWDYWSLVDTAISGKNSPDIYLHELARTPYRAMNLIDLNAMYEDDVEHNRTTLNPYESFYQSQLDVATIDGGIYSLPWSATVRVMYYNKTLFEQAGLTEADIPTTWDEIETISERLTTYETNGDYKTIGFDPFAGEGQHFHQWVWLNGGNLWMKDETGKITPTFNLALNVDTMNRLLNFPNRVDNDKLTDFMGQFGLTGVDPFVSGKIGMMIGNEGLYFNLKQAKVNFEYGVFPLPPGPNKTDETSVNWSSSFDIELFDNQHRSNMSQEVADKRNRGSWEFVKYLFSYDVQKALFENSPFLLSHKAYLLEFSGGNEILTGLALEIENSQEILYVPMAPSWNGDINMEIQEIYKKTRSAQTGLDRIQENMELKVENYCLLNPGSKGC